VPDERRETSAKEGWQVAELKEAIEAGIDWDALPMVSSNVLFEEIKQFLLAEKKQGRVLATADDLFRAFARRQRGNTDQDTLRASFEARIGRVASRDLIRRLHFGELVLLRAARLPAFLGSWHMIDMRHPDPDPFEQLVWGITGEKPDRAG